MIRKIKFEDKDPNKKKFIRIISDISKNTVILEGWYKNKELMEYEKVAYDDTITVSELIDNYQNIISTFAIKLMDNISICDKVSTIIKGGNTLTIEDYE